MDYVAMGEVITDDVIFPGSGRRDNQLGGVAYTLAGMRVWSDSVGLCGGIGRDFDRLHGGWFRANGIDTAGTAVKAERGPHSVVTYFDNGEREEIPAVGCAPISLMTPRPQELPEVYQGCKGLYVYKDADPTYWKEVVELQKRCPAVLIWEILGAAACPENRGAIQETLKSASIFSLNLTEGSRLCATREPLQIAEELLGLGARVLLLRMGADGALAADRTGIWHIPAVQTRVVDVTGGGNSSTGGFLAGYCESGGDPVTAGKWAAAAASFVIEQYGAPERIDGGTRCGAEARAKRLKAEKLR